MVEKQEFEKIGDVFRYVREHLGISQLELSKELQCTQMAISFFERHKRQPSYAIYKRFQDFLKKHKVKIDLP